MPELLVYNYRIAVKNVARKKIYQFSDTHLVEWDELSSAEEKEKASARTVHWESLRFGFARSYGEPCGDAQSLPAKTFFRSAFREIQRGRCPDYGRRYH